MPLELCYEELLCVSSHTLEEKTSIDYHLTAHTTLRRMAFNFVVSFEKDGK